MRGAQYDGNVRVNQDCTFRGQAEEIIKFNPADPNNLIAGMNDGRIGFNHCAFAWSTDAGRSDALCGPARIAALWGARQGRRLQWRLLGSDGGGQDRASDLVGHAQPGPGDLSHAA